MTIKLGVLMNPIESINPKEDSTLCMLLEAERRGWDIYYLTAKDIFLKNAIVYASMKRLQVSKDTQCWFRYHETLIQPLNTVDVLLMRQDPPIDMNYIYLTYLLEFAVQQGVLVVNNPTSLRDCNEKFFATMFKDWVPNALFTCDIGQLKAFLAKEKKAVVKPLHSMGGQSVFLLREDDKNTNVILETMTCGGRHFVLIQQYIDVATKGDKRILLIDGEPIPYAVTRIPAQDDFRGNIYSGASFTIQPLTRQDKKICDALSHVLKEKGLLFVGIDIIDNYLIEINITSPGCLSNVEENTSMMVAQNLFDAIEKKLPIKKKER